MHHPAATSLSHDFDKLMRRRHATINLRALSTSSTQVNQGQGWQIKSLASPFINDRETSFSVIALRAPVRRCEGFWALATEPLVVST